MIRKSAVFLMLMASGLAAAQVPVVNSPTTISAGERLSDWLLRQSPQIEYPIGLMWQVPQEKAGQAQLKQALLDSVQMIPHADKLKAWIEAQVVTGRAVLPSTDARWLQVHLAQDPILAANQTLRSGSRPTTVTVLQADGALCQPIHVAGATAKSYIDVCAQGQNIPRAWIAQPDGRVSTYGIVNWNAESQPELAPGAWIWAPSHHLGFSDAFSDGFIRFLASLGAAADVSSALQLEKPKEITQHLLRRNEISASDWGEIGLIQTPSARMAEASTIRINLSKVLPYTRSNVMFQLVDWLEAGFRYTDIGNRLYDESGALQTNQTYKDKGFDFKVRLREESSYGPAIALGMRDFGGTGFFSSEYFVANKRFGDFDTSLGMGWGYMASSGNIANPFGKLDSSFYMRPNVATVSGGEVGGKAFFKGPAALFGGVQWRASDVLTYKIEREGNRYQNEPLANRLAHRSFWNFGINYRYSPAADVVLGWERGNKLMFGLSFQANLDGQNIPKLLTPPPPVYQESTRLKTSTNSLSLQQEVLSQTGWDLMSISEHSGSLELHIQAGTGIGMHHRERLERLNGLLQAYAAPHIKRWNVVFVEKTLTLAALEVDRGAWIARQTQAIPPALQQDVVTVYPPDQNVLSKPVHQPIKDFRFAVGPSYSHILGGPDAFYLYKLGVAANASYQFSPSTWAQGVLDFRAIDNFDQFKYTAPSDMPRVRTFAREYSTSSRVTIPLLQITHVNQFANNHFTSAYAGMLEAMFSGVGGEWLYRPPMSSFAFGVDINRVYQREFNQKFGRLFTNYQVNTGHATAYWDTGFSDVLVKLQAGQYLAGDRGVTMDISRSFKNGVMVGAYATKTNVSAAQFGEGSFDKGVYLALPFDVLMPKFSDRSATVAWQPLTRDGGARLARANPLYNLTSVRDGRAFYFESPQPQEVIRARADEQAFVTPPRLSQELYAEPLTASLSRSVAYAGSQLTHSQTKDSWLWAGAAVLGASLLDKKADAWSVNHSQASSIAKVGNAMPLVLGAGALASLASDGVNGAGMAALKSGGIALAANTVVRSTIGRARPMDGQGHLRFSPLSANSFKSGFPSNHVATAIALATPLAQSYDMPWLYGLGAITAIGRVQSRQHWLSDTVAGGVLGYAVGSVLTDEYRERGRAGNAKSELLASPSSLAVRWRW